MESLQIISHSAVRGAPEKFCPPYSWFLKYGLLVSPQRTEIVLTPEAQRERYQVIYLWSIIESLVPNIANNETGDLIRVQSAIQSRRGRTISTKVLGSSRFSTLRFNSLPFSGARLFNALPKHVRNLTECSKIAFKYQLDKCLSKIPDHPLLSCAHIPAQVSSNSLSIQKAPTQHRWGKTNLVGC